MPDDGERASEGDATGVRGGPGFSSSARRHRSFSGRAPDARACAGARRRRDRDETYPERLRRLRASLAEIEETAQVGVAADRAVEWLRALAETWQQADVQEAMSELLHATYERIGRSREGIRVSPTHACRLRPRPGSGLARNWCKSAPDRIRVPRHHTCSKTHSHQRGERLASRRRDSRCPSPGSVGGHELKRESTLPASCVGGDADRKCQPDTTHRS